MAVGGEGRSYTRMRGGRGPLSDVLMRASIIIIAAESQPLKARANENSYPRPMTEFRRDCAPCASLVFTPESKHATRSITQREIRSRFHTSRTGDSGVSYKSNTTICHFHNTAQHGLEH